MPKAPNYRLVKIHRNYSVEEAARLLGVHRNTVREWIKRGLPVIAGHPTLILGPELRAFLARRREQGRRPCHSGEIYCMRCRQPRAPAREMVDYQQIAPNRGRLIALCSSCEAVMYRSVNPARLPPALAAMLRTVPTGSEHICERAKPIVNSDYPF